MTEKRKQKRGKALHIAVFGKGRDLYLRFFFMNHKCIMTESGTKITRQCNYPSHSMTEKRKQKRDKALHNAFSEKGATCTFVFSL